MRIKFSIPVMEKITTPELKPDMKHHGYLEVDAVITTGEDIDIDYRSIKFNGVDVLPLLDNLPGCDDALQFIYGKTLDEAHYKLNKMHDHG